MSVFALKCIAILVMLIDHTGYILALVGYADGWTIQIMRCLGRIAFPVFAFLLVNGLQKTRDRAAYLSRLALFAIISRVPFSLAFCASNYLPAALRGAESSISLDPLWLHQLPLILLAALVYYLLLHRRGRPGFGYVLAALILPLFRLKLGGIVLMDEYLNIFYSLAISLAFICAVDAIMTNDSRYTPVELALLVSAAAAAALYILPNADYSYRAPLLIALIYLFRNSRLAQALAMAAWCVCMYSFNPLFIAGGLCACLLISLYNGKKGPAFKMGFYLFYPVHLFALYALVFLYNNFH